MSIAEIKYEDLDYGAYILEYEAGSEFTEASSKYSGSEFNKLYARRLRLPEGKGNVIYVMSKTFDSSLAFINSKNFTIPPNYHRIYYPWWYVGKFMDRRIKVSVKSLFPDRSTQIKKATSMLPYQVGVISKAVDNTFFFTSDILSETDRIMQKMNIKRNYMEFYKNFVSIIKSLTPDPEKENKSKEWNNRLILIDSTSFNFQGSKLDDNKTNPLFLLYLAYLKTRNLADINVDIDMLICSKNMFIKFNPARMDRKTFSIFRMALFKIMGTNFDDYTASLKDEEKKDLEITSQDHTLNAATNNVVAPYSKIISPSIKSTLVNAVKSKFKKKVSEVVIKDKEIKKAVKPTEKVIKDDPFLDSLKNKETIIGVNPAKDPLSKKDENLFKKLAGKELAPVVTNIKSDIDIDEEEDNDDIKLNDDTEEKVENDLKEILVNDQDVAEEILDEIQEQKVPLNSKTNSPVNSARDKKLREAQKQIAVKDSTIDQILSKDLTNVPIITENKGDVLHTTNKNLYNITFANFDKTYLNELYVKDILACFDCLKDKENPFYITGIDIKDTSDTMNYKETWSVHLTDQNKKRTTIKVDIPKFKDDRFMFIKGTKWIILKQNLYNPLVKDTADMVILTAAKKITITRKATKSLSSIERVFSLIKKANNNKLFVTGNSSIGNEAYISTLEYDELSKMLFSFNSPTCTLYFSRGYINDNKEQVGVPKSMKGNEFFIGKEGDTPVFINEDTGLDRNGRSIADIIEQNLPDKEKAIYATIKGPKQSMHAICEIAGSSLPVIVVLLVWVGLRRTLDIMGIKWAFHEGMTRMPKETENICIKFQDGILEYEPFIFAQLILNGLIRLNPATIKFDDFNNEIGYDEFIYSVFGTYNGINEIRNFHEFLIDPITKDVCNDMMLPDTPEGLLIHAVKLLADNVHVSKASDKSYRVRSIEIIPAILYDKISAQYKAYVKSGGRTPMTLNQNCILTELTSKLKTVEPYSTLNPSIEVSKTHVISTKGFNGSNKEEAYKSKEKRAYDPSSIGKIAISTSADANVGINKYLVVEPTLTNARGYRAPIEEDELKDVNIFTPIEMVTPGTTRFDDPVRTAIGDKQSQHTVPVDNALPYLVSNGFDEAIQFHLSDDFVINAEEDGKVIDVNEKLGFIMVEYKSGKTKAIYTNPDIVKNSANAFYISNKLIPIYTKVGDKFKKDEPLAYNEKYFKYSKTNGLRYTIGPLVKTAFCTTYNTFEDAGICTENLSEMMGSYITYMKSGGFKRNNNIIHMVKIGDEVEIGDSLIRYDVSIEDDELSKYLSKLSEENKEVLDEETKNDIKSDHAGKVIDIKVYSLLEPDQLSPSLGKIVREYFKKGTDKKKYLENYDKTEGINKAGYMLTDETKPIQNKYNTIKNIKGIDVLIEIYIEHRDVLGVGDKIALYSANKQIISEIIPKGYEPYSEFRPEEEIGVLNSAGTVARRMVTSVIPVSVCSKCLIELKRKIKEEIKYTNNKK